MNRHTLNRILIGLTLLGVAGCADNLPGVLRDYHNVQNEVIDHMVYVCDDDSAKAFNELYKNRIKPKEDECKERLERLNKQQISTTDQKIFAQQHLDIEANELKGEIGGLSGRYNKEVARIRRIIVKLTEDKAEQTKASQDQTFTVEASQLWQNLSNVEIPRKFAGNDGMGPPAAALAQPGGPGGPPGAGGPMAGGMKGGPPGMMGMMGGPPGGMMGGPGGGGASNAYFSMTCERIVTPAGQKDWRVIRRWRNGNTTLEPREVNGVNMLPLFSDPQMAAAAAPAAP